MSKKTLSARRIARTFVVQGLYAVLTSDASSTQVEADLLSGIFQELG